MGLKLKSGVCTKSDGGGGAAYGPIGLAGAEEERFEEGRRLKEVVMQSFWGCGLAI